MQLKRLIRFGLPLLGLLLFGVSIWAISQQLQQYTIQEILQNLQTAAIKHLLLALGLTILSYLVLTWYDVLACRYIRHPLPYPKIALAAATSYAVSNTVGFAIFTGSAIRYRLYLLCGLSAVEIAQIIAFANLSFWLGLSAVGGFLFSVEPLAVPQLLHLPFTSVHPIGMAMIAVTVAYLLASLKLKRSLRIGGRSFSLPTLDLALGQIIVSSIDWGIAVAILYVLLPSNTHLHLSYAAFFGIYLLGQIAGLVSSVPGGLGVFETVILLLLSPTIPPPKIFAALVLYRFIYYFLPLGVSVLLLGLYEIRRRKSTSLGN